jgi:hypothetical protein
MKIDTVKTPNFLLEFVCRKIAFRLNEIKSFVRFDEVQSCGEVSSYPSSWQGVRAKRSARRTINHKL